MVLLAATVNVHGSCPHLLTPSFLLLAFVGAAGSHCENALVQATGAVPAVLHAEKDCVA